MFLLYGVAAVITGFVELCLLFFQATRKRYTGFGYWTAAVGFLALGYLLYALRGQIPLRHNCTLREALARKAFRRKPRFPRSKEMHDARFYWKVCISEGSRK